MRMLSDQTREGGAYEESNVDAGTSNIVEQSVGRNLHQNIPNEQSREAYLVLGVGQAQIIFKTLQPGSGVVVSKPMSANTPRINNWNGA